MNGESVGPGLFIKLGLDTAGLDEGLNKSKKGMTEWRDEVNTNTSSMAKWGAAIVATTAPLIGLTYAVHSEIEKFGTMAQGLKDLSVQTGMTTDKLQDLRYAALLSGTNVDKLSVALNTLTLSIGNAADETGPAYKAFMGLGIDPKGRTPDEVFEDLAIALHNLKDPAQKAAIAQDIFGKSWKDMLPYMEEYLKNREEIERHQKFSAEDLKNMEDAKVGWDRLGDSVTIFEGKLFGLLLTLQRVIDKYNIIAHLASGQDIDVRGSLENAANIVTGGQYGQLSESLKTAELNGLRTITSGQPVMGGKTVNISIVQNNTGVNSDGEAMNKAVGKVVAAGSALP